MATLQLLIDRGWLMAWWILIPASAMVAVWVLAIVGDREAVEAPTHASSLQPGHEIGSKGSSAGNVSSENA